MWFLVPLLGKFVDRVGKPRVVETLSSGVVTIIGTVVVAMVDVLDPTDVVVTLGDVTIAVVGVDEGN